MKTEHQIQTQFFKDLQFLELKYPEVDTFYALPNQGKRTPRGGRYMNAEGMKKGMPDTHLPVPVGEYGSLFIEFKRDAPNKSYLKPHQREVIARLREVGNCVEVARSSGEAIAITEQYMRGEL